MVLAKQIADNAIPIQSLKFYQQLEVEIREKASEQLPIAVTTSM